MMRLQESKVRRLVIAFAIGLLSAVLSYLHKTPAGHAADFMWPYLGAKLFLGGANPYDGIMAGIPYDFDAPLFYPLPAVLLVIPFTYLPPVAAGALFFGLSSALLAWALTQDGMYWRLTTFLAAPYWIALTSNQWSPLLAAILLLPSLHALAVLKPNLGLPIFIAQPRLRSALFGAGFLGLSVLLLPSWPLDWLHNIQASRHPAPLIIFPGVILLAALIQWRDYRARLLLALAIVPQRLLFYDQLMLWLVARTPKESLLLTLCSWLAIVGILWSGHSEQWVICLVYLPALICVLRPTIDKLRYRAFRRTVQVP